MPSFSSLICPVCQQSLHLQERTLRCSVGHSFDRAKEGYYNLLLANKKRSAAPGDSRAMMDARRDFLRGGHYDPLWQQLVTLLDSHNRDLKGEFLDLGCGEGFYTAAVTRALSREFTAINGIDISKEGARLAARAHPEIGVAVGSTYALPYADESQAVALQIFAPADAAEVLRVLKPGGLYLVVSPGPEHLLELKHLLYREPTQHQTSVLEQAALTVVSEDVLSVQLELSGQALFSLFGMTPFFWNVGEERQKTLQQIESLAITASFHLALYQKNI